MEEDIKMAARQHRFPRVNLSSHDIVSIGIHADFPEQQYLRDFLTAHPEMKSFSSEGTQDAVFAEFDYSVQRNVHSVLIGAFNHNSAAPGGQDDPSSNSMFVTMQYRRESRTEKRR